MSNDIPMVMENGEPVPTVSRPLYGDKTFKNPDEFLMKAKRAVEYSQYVEDAAPIFIQDLYIVWFAKTLGNWKALLSTDKVDGSYWEVTYDGNKKQTYVDHYLKSTNTVLPDDLFQY